MCEIEGSDKFDAIRQIVRHAPVFREIRDLDSFEESVLSRERLLTTGFGRGVAVAHGRTEGVPHILIGLGLSRKGIAFESPDGKPVHLLFVIASSPSMNLDYLQALSVLVRVLRDPAAREALIAEGDVARVEHHIRTAFALSLQRLRRSLRGNPACSPAT